MLGKRVIHPGGRAATDELIRGANFRADQRVLHVACGASRPSSRITVEHGDIRTLRFADQTFDKVVAEAVTIYMDRPRARAVPYLGFILVSGIRPVTVEEA